MSRAQWGHGFHSGMRYAYAQQYKIVGFKRPWHWRISYLFHEDLIWRHIACSSWHPRMIWIDFVKCRKTAELYNVTHGDCSKSRGHSGPCKFKSSWF